MKWLDFIGTLAVIALFDWLFLERTTHDLIPKMLDMLMGGLIFAWCARTKWRFNA